MTRDELVQEVERDFTLLCDFARVCGMNPELVDCMLRLQLKVRGLYPKAPRQKVERTYRPKSRPEIVRETAEPVHVDATTRWG